MDVRRPPADGRVVILRLDRANLEPAVTVGCQPGEPLEIRIERRSIGAVAGMVVTAGGIALPQIDLGAADRVALTIDDLA